MGKAFLPDEYREEKLNSLLQTLKYKLNSNKERLYFILDGFDKLYEHDAYLVAELFNLLPFDSKNIYFFLSSQFDHLDAAVPSRKKKIFEIPYLSNSELEQLFSDFPDIDPSPLFNTFKKTPSNYQAIRRMLKNGVSIEDILQNHSVESDGLYQAEWESNLKVISENEILLSYIINSESDLDVADYANMVGEDTEKISKVIESISFLTYRNDTPDFVSDVFRKYAQGKLDHLRKSALNDLVDFIRSKQNKVSSGELNSYYNNLEAYDQLIENLNPESLIEMIKDSDSSSEFLKQIDFGVTAAKELSVDSELFRFSQLKGFVSGVKSISSLNLMLESHLIEDDIKSAIDCAVLPKLNEDRLLLLSKVAKHQIKRGRKVDSTLSDQVSHYVELVNPRLIGLDKVLEIAVELFLVFPDKALHMINKIDEYGKAGENKSDLAFAKFSLATFFENKESISSLDFPVDGLSEKRQKMITSLGLLSKDTPASSFVDELISQYEVGDKLFMLKSWIKAFPDKDDIHILVAHAIELAIATPKFTANAEFYNILASTLNFSSNTPEAVDIYDSLRAQSTEAKAVGPTLEYVRFEINLVNFEILTGLGLDRFAILKDFVLHRIEDVSLKLTALCELQRFVKNAKLENKYSDINSSIDILFEKIIKESADQFDIVKEALVIESKVNLARALKWCGQLNTQYRKDEAYSHVVVNLCKSRKPTSIDRLYDCPSRIQDVNYRHASIKAIFDRAVSVLPNSEAEFKRLKKLKNKVVSKPLTVVLCAQLLNIGKLSGFLSSGGERDHIVSEMHESFSMVLDVNKKIRIGFKVHEILFDVESSEATQFKNQCVEIMSQGESLSRELSEAIFYTVDLGVRALETLEKFNAANEKDLDLLLSRIETIESDILKAKEYARVCSIYDKKGDAVRVAKIVNEKIIPLIDKHSYENAGMLDSVFNWVGQVLFSYKEAMFINVFEKLRGNYIFKDGLLNRTIKYVSRNLMPGEPFSPVRKHRYKLNFSDILSLLNLVDLMEQDFLIFVNLDFITEQVFQKVKGRSFTESQNLDVIKRLESISKSKFSDERFIKHEGYRICVDALILKLKKVKLNREWQQLIDRGRAIGNKADIVFVLAIIADCMPPKMREEKLSILKEAKLLNDTLSSNIDKVGRYQTIIECSRYMDKELARDCIKKAIEITSVENTEDMEERRLGLIDMAHSFNEEYANRLSSILNIDPAKREIIDKELSDNIKNKDDIEEFSFSNSNVANEFYKDRFGSIAWKILAKLNASNYSFKNGENPSSFCWLVSGYTPEEAYPLYSMYIATLAMKTNNRKEAQSTIRPIFNVVLENVRLLSNLYDKNSIFSDGFEPAISEANQVMLDGDGSVEKALEFLGDWYRAGKTERLDIIDPYFVIQDLSFIADVVGKGSGIEIRILTSVSNVKNIEEAENTNIKQLFIEYWKDTIQENIVPDFTFIYIGLESKNGQMPIHDRWWLTDSSGVRLGTSVNGIGKSRLSEISILEEGQRANVEHKVMGYLEMKQKKCDGEKLSINSFTI